MRILLDTHIYLWWLADSPALTQEAREIIEAAETVHVSTTSLWEAVVKIGLGKLVAKPQDLVTGIRESGFEALPVTPEHILALSNLADHHRDPFDRMLIAQAISEPLHLITADRVLPAYSDLVIKV